MTKTIPKNGYKKPRWLPVTFNWIGPRASLAEVKREITR